MRFSSTPLNWETSFISVNEGTHRLFWNTDAVTSVGFSAYYYGATSNTAHSFSLGQCFSFIGVSPKLIYCINHNL